MPGVGIDLRKIDDLIRRDGVWVEWYAAKRCPCLTQQGRPTRACPVCDGLGWLRGEAKRVRGLLTADSKKRRRDAGGEVETGMRSFTPPRWVRLAEGDWIRPLQYAPRTSEVLIYGAPTGRGDKLNELFPTEVLSIESIRNGAIHTFDPAAYTDTSDPAKPQTVAQDGGILWQPGHPDLPTAGEQYTVEFKYHELYQVVRGEKPMNRGAQDKRLPDRVTLKLATRRIMRGA